LCIRQGSADALAQEIGVCRPTLYNWKNQLLGRGVSAIMKHRHDLPPGPEREELGRQLEGGALGRAAVAGAGIVLQPEDALIGRLVPVLLAWSYRPTPVHLVYMPDRRPAAKLCGAIDFIVARFGVDSP
jgi:DNA-binding transcriptional LysR family regulator